VKRNDAAPIKHESPWWRFARYEVRSGFILPAPDAKLEKYDPWEQYWRSVQDPRVPAPYASLLALSAQLGERKPGRSTVNEWRGGICFMPWAEEDDKHVTDWCSVNGLLGLLPGRARRMTLAPRWDRDVEPSDPLLSSPLITDEERAAFGDLYIAQVEHRRNPFGWLSVRREHRLPGYVPREEDVGGLATPVLAPKDWPEESTVLESAPTSQPIECGDATTRSNAIQLGPYFPRVAEHELATFAYPAPFSDAFWQAYGEPVWEFFYAARLLRQAFEILTGPNVESNNTGHPLAPLEVRERRAIFYMSSLMAQTPTVLSEAGPRVRQQTFMPPSLLAAYGMMIALDLTRWPDARTCARCGKSFRPRSPQAIFCGESCRKTVAQAQRRGRQLKLLTEALGKVGKIKPARAAGTVARSLLRHTGSIRALQDQLRSNDAAGLLELARRHVPACTHRQLAQAVKMLRP